MSKKITEKEYYCPACEKGFDVQEKNVTPCCFAPSDEIDDGSQREKCRECGEICDGDRIIIVCPHCDNDGSNGLLSPGYWDCMQQYIESAEEN